MMANSRHAAWASHWMHTALAAAICSSGPVVPKGRKRSDRCRGSAAPSRRLQVRPGALSAGRPQTSTVRLRGWGVVDAAGEDPRGGRCSDSFSGGSPTPEQKVGNGRFLRCLPWRDRPPGRSCSENTLEAFLGRQHRADGWAGRPAHGDEVTVVHQRPRRRPGSSAPRADCPMRPDHHRPRRLCRLASTSRSEQPTTGLTPTMRPACRLLAERGSDDAISSFTSPRRSGPGAPICRRPCSCQTRASKCSDRPLGVHPRLFVDVELSPRHAAASRSTSGPATTPTA
jgi:hypothetical protein